MADNDEPRIIDWPYPEPGPGMTEATGADPWTYPAGTPALIAAADLRRQDVPGPNAGWEDDPFAVELGGGLLTDHTVMR